MRVVREVKRDKVADNLFITFHPIGRAKIFEIDAAEAEEFSEAPIQLMESRRYEYELSDKNYRIQENEGSTDYFKASRSTQSRGFIEPGNYVGTLELCITNGIEHFPYHLEVLATKFDANDDYDKSYRENYRSMLEDITEKCTELLMQANSPVNQYFEPDFGNKSKLIYQKFSFVKSVLNNPEFDEALLKIFSTPKTTWTPKEEKVDVRSIKRFSNKNVKELLKGTNRMPVPSNHSLATKFNLNSIPTKIDSYKQEASLDNAENRFIKHALQVYLQFCERCNSKFKTGTKDQREATQLVQKLSNYLNHSFFKDISRPTTLRLNSPTLQRKGGYRQQLKIWLMFDLASKLTWSGGEDVYDAGKRDIATLYEYWLFFVLYDLFKQKFSFSKLSHDDKGYKHLFEKVDNGLNLIIKSGKHTALQGVTTIKNRKLNVKFSFNRTFSGHKDSYPKAGSWTTAMRPDYTLSVWPEHLDETVAEQKEEIVHIHFDAKYKVHHFTVKTNSKDVKINVDEENDDLKEQKSLERQGKFKNADLLKMHAYKDAIRRTGGAYILYPGTTKKQFKGFHELIPGLGAFSLNPDNEKEDTKALSEFIDKVILELVNRSSHRENIANKTYEITKAGEGNKLFEPMPEYVNGEKLIPDETFVLVGYVKNKLRNKRMGWFLEKGMYNFRMNDDEGALNFTEKETKAKFLLLRESTDGFATKLYKLKKGIKVFSGTKLESRDYKHPDAKKDAYLIVSFDPKNIQEFENTIFNYSETKEYKELIKELGDTQSSRGRPFTTTLTSLLKNSKSK